MLLINVWGSKVTEDEMSAIGTLITNAVNTAVEAAIAPIYERLDRVDQGLDRLETMVMPMAADLRTIGTIQRRMNAELVKVVPVLDEATIVINELQNNQRALEIKVDENTGILKRDIQRLDAKIDENTATLRRDIQRVAYAVQNINERVTKHENTPLDEAHRRPKSPT
jgi:tetrahydromethanopterin S-methyltransferase subunit B